MKAAASARILHGRRRNTTGGGALRSSLALENNHGTHTHTINGPPHVGRALTYSSFLMKTWHRLISNMCLSGLFASSHYTHGTAYAGWAHCMLETANMRCNSNNRSHSFMSSRAMSQNVASHNEAACMSTSPLWLIAHNEVRVVSPNY